MGPFNPLPFLFHLFLSFLFIVPIVSPSLCPIALHFFGVPSAPSNELTKYFSCFHLIHVRSLRVLTTKLAHQVKRLLKIDRYLKHMYFVIAVAKLSSGFFVIFSVDRRLYGTLRKPYETAY